jgi:hypothetical protein
MVTSKAWLSTALLKSSSPSYAIFGEKAMLNVKIIPPVFRKLRTGLLVMDSSRKGRLLLEWSPRADGGKSQLLCEFCLEFICPAYSLHRLCVLIDDNYRRRNKS